MLDEKTVWLFRIVAALLCGCFYFVSTAKMLGVMQQSGYKNKKFFTWLRQKDNTYFSRLAYWSILSLAATALFIFVFFFLQEEFAMAMGGIPFFGFSILFYCMDRKFALKVETVKSSRWKRLSVVYSLLVCGATLGLILLCGLLKPTLEMADGWLSAIRFLPICFMPMLLPLVLALANLLIAPFETWHNRNFVKKAGKVLAASKCIKVGIVGSYGKTSVKNIFKQLLEKKYRTVATPASYNTPMGVARTVFSPEFAEAEIFLCEMGARNEGDIRELCDLVRPDYILFTGVCPQHVQTFGDEETVFRTKCEALASSAKTVVCGGALQSRIAAAYPQYVEKCLFVQGAEEVCFQATETQFSVPVDGEKIPLRTRLLGEAAVENLSLAATAAKLLGLTGEEIASAATEVQYVEHRLQLIESGGIYILDDAYNCNAKGAAAAIEVLKRFEKGKFVVTPGIVEAGVLHQELNGRLGEILAKAELDLVILVGETQAKVIIEGYKSAGGEESRLKLAPSVQHAVKLLQGNLSKGDCVLFMNDLPDVL